MPNIHTLPDNLINKIAAGEVVERPASVVKELVENSLDAGASRIEIQLEDGGKKSILVRDNGSGIGRDELKLAISRHSTSKIQTDEDLFRIQTMGFRGEALASIASVSKLKITSKLQNSNDSARELLIEGGKTISEEDAGHPEGTTISVKYLFYQTPARLKFLKGKETEMSRISDYVTRAALSNPQVSFNLEHNGRKVLKTLTSAGLKERIHDLFGKDMSEGCYEISGGLEGMEICGMAGHPQLSRSHNRNMYLFINGRPVRDKVVHHAIFEGYRDLLMKGRYPFVILFIKLPLEMVDVNVHPAKAEVRFSNSSVVHRAVYDAVRKTLVASPWQGEGEGRQKAEDGGLRTEGNKSYQPSSFNSQSSEGSTSANQLYVESQRAWTQTAEKKNATFGKTPYAQMEILGQLLGTYILCQAENKLLLVDQHAAHERVRFEKLMRQYKAGEISSQRLLIPENFDLNPSEVEILKRYGEELLKFGLEIDFFGGTTFVVKAIPSLFGTKVKIKSLVLDLIGDVLEKGELTSLKDKMHDVLASMACHSALRAHHLLTLDQMQGLLKELDEYPFTSFCPHGRPVSVEVTEGEIEKWFKRIV